MTALCGGGTSSPKPGTANNVLFDVSLISQGLQIISPWLIPFSALIENFTYNAVASCGTDPPAMPTFSASDALNLIGGILNPNLGVTLAKVNDALLNYAWGLLCQCDNGTVVPPPTTVGPPPGIQVGGQGAPQPCATGSLDATPALIASGSQFSKAVDIHAQFLPTDGRRLTITDSQGSYPVYGLPTSVTQLDWQAHYQVYQFCSTIPNKILFLQFFTSAGGSLGAYNFDNGVTPGIDQTGSLKLSTVPTASYWRLVMFNDPAIGGCGVPVGDVRLSIQTWCGTSPGLPSSCCPPDSSLMNGIQNLQDMIKRIAFTHGAGPTSYVDGVTHTGLSGAGSFVLSGDALGVRVTMTTLPTGTPVLAGDPTFYWDAGFITPIAAGSPLRGTRLVFTPQTMLIPLVADSIGYTLLHGTVVSVTELLPSPAP